MAAAHHVKDSLSDAMHRIGIGGSNQNNHEHSTTSHENDNTRHTDSTRHLSLDTSNIAKVLVIGETGSGKSTFINYLTNYFRGGSLQNIKTDMCNQYIFVDSASPAQRQYLFLDTPGLSDTRGAEQDNINMNKIIDGVSFHINSKI